MRFTKPKGFTGSGLLFLGLLMSLQPLLADDKLSVFVSVLPQQLFVERIGGEAVAVEVMVKPGFSPATYEPSPRQIAALAKTQLYIRIGVPFEAAWLPRIRSVNPDMLLLDARDSIELLKLDDRHHGHEAQYNDEHSAVQHADIEHTEHTGAKKVAHVGQRSAFDPHLWTDPQRVITMAQQIKRQLTALVPAQAEVFQANYVAFAAELQALDDELRALFARDDAADNKKFLVFHPSWGYFAATYGLTQLAIEAEGKEPGAKALQALIRQAKAARVKTIFVQPQFDQRAARQVAKAIKGEVVAIDPLAADYFANMRRAARLIAGVGDE